jgi:hypothetical protein
MSDELVQRLNALSEIQVAIEHVGYYLTDLREVAESDILQFMTEFRIDSGPDYFAELESSATPEEKADDFDNLPEVVELGRAYFKALRAVNKARLDAGWRG